MIDRYAQCTILETACSGAVHTQLRIPAGRSVHSAKLEPHAARKGTVVQ